MNKIRLSGARKFLLSAMVAFAAAFSSSADLRAADDDAILNKIASKNAGYKTMEYKFDHVKTTATKVQVTMHGTSYYTASDKFALIYTDPATERFIINGTKLYMNRSGKVQNIDITKVASMKMMSTCVLCGVSGRISDILKAADYDCKVEETKDAYVVTLTAKQKAAKGYARILLSYRKSDCVCSLLEMEEFNHVVNTYTMLDGKVNGKVEDSVYSIK